MLRLLTAIGALLSLFTVTTGSEARSSTDHTKPARWASVVKTHNPFGNWT